MSKKITKNDDWLYEEVIETPATEYIEENFFVEESLVKNKELIRMEMNLIQLPIFSKNTKRKINQVVKYFFNSNRDTYITVTPTAGNYIPGEMEEKVFIALMQLMKEKGMQKQFIISGTELRDKLKINTIRYGNIIKNSLLRLSETNYKFRNTMYSSELRGIINKEISTPILILEIITLSLKQNEKYRKIFCDNRIKEVYKITITDHFYNNIIQKGYMVYNSKILLDISTSTARTIYMLIEKLRFEKISLKIDAIFLIKRIPLKFDKSHLTQTMTTLKKAFEELKNKKLIKDFEIIKDSSWEKSEIEIFFNEQSKEEKQQRFFEDRNDFRKILTSTTVSETEHKMIEYTEIVENSNSENSSTVPTIDMIDKILGLMPSKARSLKSMPKTIKEAIEKYGYSKVEAAAIYMKKNKVVAVRAYFIKTLENNWIEDEETIIKPVKTDFKALENENTAQSMPGYDVAYFEAFEELSESEQNKIENIVYKNYTDECGMNTKIQKIAFSASRKKYISEFLEKNENLLNKSLEMDKAVIQNVEPVEASESMDDISEIKKKILEALELADIVYSYSESAKKELLISILKEVIAIRNEGILTAKKLTEIIGNHF